LRQSCISTTGRGFSDRPKGRHNEAAPLLFGDEMARKKRRKAPTKRISRQAQSRWKWAFQNLGKIVIGCSAIYGAIAVLYKAIPESEEFYTRINPLLSIEAKMNQAKPWETEFLLKNEGNFRLHNAEVITEFIRADLTNNTTYQSMSSQTDALFPDIYGNVGDIRAKSTVLIPIPEYLRQIMAIPERKFPSESWKRIALCHRVVFAVFPINLLPVGKQRQSIGSFFDKEAGIHDWREHSCEGLRKALLPP
jgi:hypothetical protein